MIDDAARQRDEQLTTYWLRRNVHPGEDWRQAVRSSVKLRDVEDLDLLVEASDEAVERLDQQLNDSQKEDVAIVAARMQAEATVEAAEISSKATSRASAIAFLGTVLGAAIGAGASNWIYAAVAS